MGSSVTLQLANWNREIFVQKRDGKAGLVCNAPFSGPGVVVSKLFPGGGAELAGLQVTAQCAAVCKKNARFSNRSSVARESSNVIQNDAECVSVTSITAFLAVCRLAIGCWAWTVSWCLGTMSNSSIGYATQGRCSALSYVHIVGGSPDACSFVSQF